MTNIMIFFFKSANNNSPSKCASASFSIIFCLSLMFSPMYLPLINPVSAKMILVIFFKILFDILIICIQLCKRPPIIKIPKWLFMFGPYEMIPCV